jgi:hypothetical protein
MSSYFLRYALEIVIEVVRVGVVTAVVAVLVGAVGRVVPVPVMSMMVAFMMFRHLFAMPLPYCATVDNGCCPR